MLMHESAGSYTVRYRPTSSLLSLVLHRPFYLAAPAWRKLSRGDNDVGGCWRNSRAQLRALPVAGSRPPCVDVPQGATESVKLNDVPTQKEYSIGTIEG